MRIAVPNPKTCPPLLDESPVEDTAKAGYEFLKLENTLFVVLTLHALRRLNIDNKLLML